MADGGPTAYRDAARRLGALIVEQVDTFRSGEDVTSGGGSPILELDEAEADPMTRAIRSAGRTIQLDYLGRESGTQAPDVFEAYVADRDFDRTGLTPLSIRLLLSKRDLSDLDQALRIIIRKGEDNVLSPGEMFRRVLSAAADMSGRPDQVVRNADTTMADAVSITGMLDGLPYRSRIMTVTEEDWVSLGIAEQQFILSGLIDKGELYARFDETTDQWVDHLGTGPDAGNLLYPMKLDDLP